MRFKRTKNVRMRASQTHGWGAKKKHRGAGHRGGRGHAGTGKRADQKKPSIWADHHYFGKFGFVSLQKKKKAVNLAYLEEKTESLLKEGAMKKVGDYYEVKLMELDYHKLLSKGKVTRKYRITCNAASPGAIEKVKAVGGEVIVADV